MDTSGLDMKDALEWYASSGAKLKEFERRDLPYVIENSELIGLSNEELGGLFYLMPENARKRSIVRKVVGKKPLWFHRDSDPANSIKTTENQDEAISPTAFIPSYIDYSAWPQADIELYQIPGFVPDELARMVLAHGFMHESLGHSIVQPALYSKDYKLRFSDGRILTGLEACMEFAEMTERLSPISHYASSYRNLDNTFVSDGNDKRLAISEEMSETIAALNLGFSYCKDDDYRSRNPFADRPQVKGFVENLLNAELVPASS